MFNVITGILGARSIPNYRRNSNHLLEEMNAYFDKELPVILKSHCPSDELIEKVKIVGVQSSGRTAIRVTVLRL